MARLIPRIQNLIDQIDQQPVYTSRLFRELSYTIKQIHDDDQRREQALATADECAKRSARFGRTAFLVACNITTSKQDYDI
jgi:hypothetical protein